MRILILAKDTEEAAPYRAVLQTLRVEAHEVHDTQAALEALREKPFNGVLIDMPTLLRMAGKGRNELQNILSLYPCLHARPDKQTGIIILGQEGDPHENVRRFIETRCKNFSPRTIRRDARLDVHFNILMSTSALFTPQTTVKTCTMNISVLGCFVFSVAVWQPDTQVWIQFVDLEDKTPVVAKVCQVQRWGKGCKIPGVGLEFLSLTDNQIAGLQNSFAQQAEDPAPRGQ
jgi:hypothetical protein